MTIMIGSRLWTPESITTGLWLDAADADTITESGGKVSRWDDKSGNGNDAVQGIGAIQPDYLVGQITGNDALILNLLSDIFLGKTQGAVVFAGKQVADGSHGGWGMYANRSSSQAKTRFPNGDNGEIRGSFGNTLRITGNASTTYTEGADLLGAEVNNGSTLAFRHDGEQIGSAQSATFSDTVQTNRLFGMGGGYTLYEIIFLENIVDVEKTEGYLAWKWGLQANLDVLHPYYNYPPAA